MHPFCEVGVLLTLLFKINGKVVIGFRALLILHMRDLARDVNECLKHCFEHVIAFSQSKVRPAVSQPIRFEIV